MCAVFMREERSKTVPSHQAGNNCVSFGIMWGLTFGTNLKWPSEELQFFTQQLGFIFAALEQPCPVMQMPKLILKQ